jgi:hypothetical protein
MIMNSNQYQEIESFIKVTLMKVISLLDDETIHAVNHYLDHSEVEMAFEILYLEIMARPATLSMIDPTKSRSTALLLALDKETIFEPNFWTMLDTFLDS